MTTGVIADLLSSDICKKLDVKFVSNDTEVADTSPAGIRSEAQAVASTGATAAAVAADVRGMIEKMVAGA